LEFSLMAGLAAVRDALALLPGRLHEKAGTIGLLLAGNIFRQIVSNLAVVLRGKGTADGKGTVHVRQPPETAMEESKQWQ
jgi:hypothetical protein